MAISWVWRLCASRSCRLCPVFCSRAAPLTASLPSSSSSSETEPVVSASGRCGWAGKAAPAAGAGEGGRCWGRGGEVWWGSSNWRPPGWSQFCIEGARGHAAGGAGRGEQAGAAAGRRRLPAVPLQRRPSPRNPTVAGAEFQAPRWVGSARRSRERGHCWAARSNLHTHPAACYHAEPAPAHASQAGWHNVLHGGANWGDQPSVAAADGCYDAKRVCCCCTHVVELYQHVKAVCMQIDCRKPVAAGV